MLFQEPLNQMQLESISLHHFRRFEAARWEPFGKINLFFGENGAGKSSLLEALTILALGRSFRSHSNEVVIAHGDSSFALHSSWTSSNEKSSLGLEYSRAKGLKILKDGSAWPQARHHLALRPLRVFTPENLYLLSSGHEARLNFLNWGCFHLFPEFKRLWSIFSRLLEHRRALLKQSESYEQLQPWDSTLCQITEKLDTLRSAHLQALRLYWESQLPAYFPRYPVTISFSAGWDASATYLSQLANSFQWDRRHHSTRFGAHRADFSLSIFGYPANQILSRGEMKALILSLGILQMEFVTQENQNVGLLLIDEFDAELDATHKAQLKSVLKASSAQIFLTALSSQSHEADWHCFALKI